MNSKNSKQNKAYKSNNKYELLEKPLFYNSKLSPQSVPTESDSQKSPNPNSNNNSQNVSSSNQNNINLVVNNKKSNWQFRYGYNRNNKFNIIEDENYFKEHEKNLEKNGLYKNKSFESEDKLYVFYNDERLADDEIKYYKTFSELDLHSELLKNFEKMKYSVMTPIQRYIIPYVLQGNDCIGCAETGSGKTISFLSPIISLMLNSGPPEEDKNYLKTDTNYSLSCSYPVVLILVPTRELAEQTYIEARKLLYKTGIAVCKCYGGISLDVQIKELKYGVDIVIGTPGRIIELIEKRFIYLNLIKYLIIDENDRMLDMGFEPQLKEILSNKNMPSKDDRINLMFSATITSSVLKVAKQFTKEKFYLVTTSENIENKDYNTNKNVEQLIYFVNDEDKVSKLHEIFQEIQGNVLVFLETKKGVDKLEENLSNRNYNVVSIHGDKLQSQRQEAIKLFSSGEVPILIATDVASRGLDFPDVSYVINYDFPKNIEDYIHRIGRTGRIGKKGTAISFYNDKNQQISKQLVKELKKTNQKIPEFLEKYYFSEYQDLDYYNDNYGKCSKYGYKSKDYKKNYEQYNYSKKNYWYNNKKGKYGQNNYSYEYNIYSSFDKKISKGNYNNGENKTWRKKGE